MINIAQSGILLPPGIMKKTLIGKKKDNITLPWVSKLI
jgi:hypothetical protein